MIIAAGNLKSSVGKTTTLINLAGALIEQNYTVKLWDLDGQRDLLKVGQAAGFDVTAPLPISLKAAIAAAPADFHLIECPPRREMESQIMAALVISDRLIIPNECEHLMMRGLANFDDIVKRALVKNPSLQWRALVTKFKPRQKKHLASFIASEQPRFETIIRDSAWVADASIYDKTVLQYAPRSAPARAFRSLAQEVIAWQK